MTPRKPIAHSHIVTRIALGLIALLTAYSTTLAQSFSAPVSYTVGSHPYAAAPGDFNGDGKLDLVVANNSSNSVSVLLGNGDTTFGAKTDYAVGAGAYGVVVTDLNGDGKLDIASVNSFASISNISILLGNGNGTFQNKVDYTFPGAAQPNSLLAADFNSDANQTWLLLTETALLFFWAMVTARSVHLPTMARVILRPRWPLATLTAIANPI